MKKIRLAIRLSLFGLLFIHLLTACGIRDYIVTDKYVPIDLSSPDYACKSPQSWQGLIPGKSVRYDVTNVLGSPNRTGRYEGQEFYEYTQMMAAGDDLLTNKVFFHNDKTDRFEVVVADVDGRFHTVGEIALELGEELDVVYWEGDIDVFGPGLVYVWAECGVALIAIPPEMIPSMDDSPPQLAVPENTQLKIRHPIPLQSATLMEPDMRDIVMIKVLFAPTSYDSFKEAYWGKCLTKWVGGKNSF